MARAARHRPVGDEAAEVVDPRDVEQLERAPQALGPPAVAAPLQRRPVVQRVAPQLPLVGVGVGRRARDRVVAEQLRVRAVVGRAGRDVDRHVADQPHPALLGVRAQRRPLAVEPHLVGDRAARAESRPVVDPERVALAEVELGRPSTPARAGRPAGPARPRTPTRDLYGEPCRSGGPSGSICHHDWPASASQSTNACASRPSRPDGQRGGVQLDAAGARKVHRGAMPDTPARSARAQATPNPRPGSGSTTPRRRSTADATRPSAAVGDTVARLRRHLPRRPRDPARGRALQGAGRPPLARGAAAPDRRARQRRPLGGRVHGRDARAAGSGRSRPGATCSPPGATSSSARSPPARPTSPARSPRAS